MKTDHSAILFALLLIAIMTAGKADAAEVKGLWTGKESGVMGGSKMLPSMRR